MDGAPPTHPPDARLTNRTDVDREELTPERRGRRAKRVRVVVLLAVLVCLAAGAGAAILVPPALAELPNDPLRADTEVRLGPLDSGGDPVSAAVSVGKGWTRIGTGPFLPDDRVNLVSPDGRCHVQVELVPGGSRAAEQGRAAPGDAARKYAEKLRTASWSTETLTSGNTVRYTTIPDGGEAVTVAVVDPTATVGGGDADTRPPAQIVLVASAPADDAPLYRTVTADLVSSAAFSLGKQARD
jgi:hypothetical protein